MNTSSEVSKIPETTYPCPNCVNVGHPPEKCDPATWKVDDLEMCGDCYESHRVFVLTQNEEN